MKVNKHGLNDTIEEIKTMVKNLEQANDVISSIIIPSDCEYASNIRITYDYIEGIIYNLTGLAVWIRTKVDDFETTDRAIDAINAELNKKMLDILEPKDIKGKTEASIANVGIKFTEGVAGAVEGVIDGVATITVNNDTGIHDKMQLVDSDGNIMENPIVKYREGVMSFVAEEHVENAYEDFYNNTNMGRNLDEKAYEPFKSDGIGCEVAKGIGYTAAIAATGAVSGGSSAVTAGLMTTTAFISALGKYDEEFMASLRDASWQGMEEMYADGKIAEEVFNSYMMIRCLSDEQWDEIENDYNNGIITSEEYEQMKYLREMPEKWTTKENLQKGIAYGTASGLWEGIQWYVGANLAKWISSATLRIGVDTAFNAADTPVRAGIDSLVTGQAYDEAWIEQGGWASVVANAGIGLVGSAGGEIIDAANNIGKTNRETIDVDKIVKTNGNYETLNLDEHFQYLRDGNGKYGVDQGCLRDLDPKSYIDLKNMVIDRYNMSAKDAAKIISALDSVGACSYAEIANELFTFFKDIPDEFEKYFGFPLYVEGENGLININDKELLLDMYIFINSEVNGGYLIGTDKSGNNYIKSGMIDGMFGRYWLKSENAQRYMSGADGVNAILVNKYLKSKGYPGRYTTEVINSVDENVEINALKSEIKQSMESGEAVSIGLRSKTDRPINFVDIDKGEIYNNTLSWGEGSGHAVCVTGVREDGIVISSWGKKFLLMDSDLDGKAAYRTSKSRIIDVNINARRLKWFWEK